MPGLEPGADQGPISPRGTIGPGSMPRFRGADGRDDKCGLFLEPTDNIARFDAAQ